MIIGWENQGKSSLFEASMLGEMDEFVEVELGGLIAGSLWPLHSGRKDVS